MAHPPMPYKPSYRDQVPIVQPFIRLVPKPGLVWTDDDAKQATRAMDYAREGYGAVSSASHHLEGPNRGRDDAEIAYCRQYAISQLESARWELERLLDRLAQLDVGVQHNDLGTRADIPGSVHRAGPLT
jgi:hypothetical protein